MAGVELSSDEDAGPARRPAARAQVAPEGDRPPVWSRRYILAELTEAFESSLPRRLKRLESKLADSQMRGEVTLRHAAQSNGTATNGHSAPNRLSEALARALKLKPQRKAFGPSGRQLGLADPPEKLEDAVAETTTLKLTLESLDQNLQNRRRQSGALRSQLGVCEEMCRDVERQTEAAAASERKLLQDPAALEPTHSEGVRRRRERVDELLRSTQKAQEQAKRYQRLFSHQRRYLLQTERIALIGGHAALSRHPAGDIVLVPLPMPVGDDKPEVWDIGTAIANPYCVDSWPFEPNVLARRTFQKEAALDPFDEETEEQLEEERRRLPFLPSLRFPPSRGHHEDEYEDDDDYNGPTATSRSL